MNKSETTNLLSHIKKYEQDPIVMDVISGKSRFVDEFMRFYDCEIFRRFRCGYESHFRESNVSKVGSRPSRLVELVDKFSDNTIDVSMLEYETVRTDYQSAQETTLKDVVDVSLVLGSMLATVGSLCYSFINPKIGIPLTIITGYAYFKIGIKQLTPPKDLSSDRPYTEFWKLFNATREADDFMKSYKEYIKLKSME